ncbi:MAG: twin arginine-targeting protein translocase TatC [Betaproteobacteria bacterium RIFCSPLOWO2_12_FULL_63_13]|nr:MAG: twin arginine-targeting protein translocase TatC [Betaproteobacteria bacterium RIFCSPLOWO2_02_FULL_63_19]OGA52430.1 MAG: twin arginine-targeting protein translocase TatC [Betaproteobacteria bacterium RIFCSPLOWO2_12_FULL_63_13]
MSSQDTFISHLVELRQRLVRVILALLIVCLCLLPWAREIYSVLARPLLASLPAGGQMIATDVIGPFLVPLKVTLLVAFVVVLPYVLHEAWAFVAPGLYAHEKRLVLPLVVASFLLFLVGMSFAYFLVFPMVFRFMAAIAPEGVAWMTDIDKYFSFVLTTFIAFGVTFEVPVVVIMLVRTGMVSIDKLKLARPYVIVGAFVVGAVITPPDVLSQVMLAVPLWILYELGLVLARFVAKSDQVADDALSGDERSASDLRDAESGPRQP